MFSTVVAFLVFLLSSMLLIAVAYDALRTKSESEKAREVLEHYVRGYRTVTDWRKVTVLILFWIASGIYLWG